MKRAGVFLAVVLVLGLLLVTDAAQPKSQPAFDKLKALAGEWEGKNSKGYRSSVSYRVASGGSALEERLVNQEDGHDMITMYHLNGDGLLMTHYCAAGNQPRMRGEVSRDGKIVFTFFDATNLSSRSAGHMAGLVITFVDKDHLTQEWAWHENGTVAKEVFQFTRKK